MSDAERQAALQALRDAEAALAAADAQLSVTTEQAVPSGNHPTPPVTKYFDQGPQYLGPCAVNGT